MVDLPPQFKALSSLLDRMTIRQPANSAKSEPGPGLLALGQFGDAVETELKVDGPEMKAIKDLLADGSGRNVRQVTGFSDRLAEQALDRGALPGLLLCNVCLPPRAH